jgi:uncharacterized membrane protein SpoIIM required for sporulation
MAELQLKSQRFRTEREWSWRQLDSLLNKVQRKGARALTDEELLAAPVLYRQAMSSLSVARSISLDRGVVGYLESLCLRGYLFVYGVRSTPLEKIGRFFAHDWPTAVRSVWRETLLSLFVFVLGAAVAWVMVSHDPDWFYSFTGGMSDGRDPAATTAYLRGTLYDNEGANGLSYFASFLFTHNTTVSILAFALGFAFCLPTAYLIFQNGAMLGAMMWLFTSRGLGVEMAGWLMIHGVTEIFAIILSGAAGFRIGWSIIRPGDRPRLESAAAAGRSAGAIMAGVVIMLLLAGLLEGFGRQLINVDWIRFAIAGFTGLVWLTYFYIPRSAADDRG